MSRPSLLDAVHDVLVTLPSPASQAHPFSNSSSSLSSKLNSILDMTSQWSYALTQLSAIPPSDQTSKLVSLLKQHAAISASIGVTRAATTSLASADRRVLFPDMTPPSPSRLVEWGRSAGMETFIESSSRSATSTFALGGKVLVLDIDIDGGVVVKTSFAVGSDPPNGASAAPHLDAFLARQIFKWVEAAKRASSGGLSPDIEDPAMEAAICVRSLQSHLRYLMMLDSLAVGEGERGIRWFMEPVTACQSFDPNVQYAAGRSTVQALDQKLAQRALPILYFDTLSLSFLVWLSPLAYLRLLRSSPPRAVVGPIDISLAHLKDSLAKNSEGATIVSLRLVPSSDILSTTTMALADDHNSHTFPSTSSHSWVLDFSSRPYPSHGGIVVSQSRMRAIQNILGVDMTADYLMGMGVPTGTSVGNGMGSMGSFGSVRSIGQLSFNGFTVPPSQATSFGNSSAQANCNWVDLLFNTGSPVEHYHAIYQSPSNGHPPLNLRLEAPQEPGFVLQKVPVRNSSQVLRILEIVKEQCWLNEMLSTLEWQPESISLPPKYPQQASGGVNATAEDMLASMLTGTLRPNSIPVSVYLPSTPLAPLSQMYHPSVSGISFGLNTLGSASSVSGRPSSSGSLFGTGDMEMEMEIPGLSMSMNSSAMDVGMGIGMGMGIDVGIGGMGMGAMGMELGGPTGSLRVPPMIILSTPTRAPAVGLVELRVSFVEENSTGIGAGFGGSTGPSGSDCRVKVESLHGIDTRGMEEVVRRGGIWGLPGRIWSKGHR